MDESDVVKEFQEVSKELAAVAKKMMECVDFYVEPFDENLYPCYKKYKSRYKFLQARLMLLWDKLERMGYSDKQIIRWLSND